MNDYDYLEQLAFEGVRHLNMHHDKTFNVTYHTIQDGMIKLPSGFIDYLLVGAEHNGHLVALTLNPYLYNPTTKTVDGDIQYMTPEQIGSYGSQYYEPHYYRGQYVPTLYAIGTGFAEGYFSIDKENRVAYISDRVNGSQVVMQWVGVADLCGSSAIEPKYHETLLAWMDWKVAEGDDRKYNIVDAKEATFKRRLLESKVSELPGLWDFAELISLGTHRGIKA